MTVKSPLEPDSKSPELNPKSPGADSKCESQELSLKSPELDPVPQEPTFGWSGWSNIGFVVILTAASTIFTHITLKTSVYFAVGAFLYKLLSSSFGWQPRDQEPCDVERMFQGLGFYIGIGISVAHPIAVSFRHQPHLTWETIDAITLAVLCDLVVFDSILREWNGYTLRDWYKEGGLTKYVTEPSEGDDVV
uniref:Uncharacterized protein n=1 Tax=Mycena chlorophos TaxID=658473 RepID=A0ABQ0M8Y5_MYCCL|nr:predicted protein [Mycena chlorophos]